MLCCFSTSLSFSHWYSPLPLPCYLPLPPATVDKAPATHPFLYLLPWIPTQHSVGHALCTFIIAPRNAMPTPALPSSRPSVHGILLLPPPDSPFIPSPHPDSAFVLPLPQHLAIRYPLSFHPIPFPSLFTLLKIKHLPLPPARHRSSHPLNSVPKITPKTLQRPHVLSSAREDRRQRL